MLLLNKENEDYRYKSKQDPADELSNRELISCKYPDTKSYIS